MFRFTRTTAAVTAIALTASLYSVTSASAFNPGVRHAPVHHGHHGMRHHGGGGYGRAMAIGAGVGLGLMVLNAAIAAQQAQQPRVIEVVREPRQPKKPPVVKRAPKVEPPEQIVIRTAHPVYVTPKLPDVQKQDCNNANCDQLWQSIVHYKSIILEDSRKLADRVADVQNKKARAEAHRQAAGKAKTKADRDYQNEMARIEDASATQLEADNANLAKLIEEEQKILKDRIAQYEDCVKRACAQQVGAAPAAVVPR